jgi:magnesium-protoporphyrin O-methyltransferase
MRAYHKRGARGATRRLLDAVRASMRERGTADSTHLDIGGGVGVLQHELARDGAVHTTAVDASRSYLEVVCQAAAERGYEARQRRIEGDFTEVADRVESATVVTLDKVICCYPDMVTLVRASARKATALYGIVVPRDTAWVRASVGLVNWFRTGRSTVCAPRKGSTWIGMIPACSGACGSIGGSPPDGYAVPARHPAAPCPRPLAIRRVLELD